MNIENQVCTLEQGKALARFGVKNNFWIQWWYSDRHKKWYPVFREQIQLPKSSKPTYPAPTASEMANVIPDYTQKLGNLEIGKCETDHITMKPLDKTWWNVSYWTWAVKDHSKGGCYLEQQSKHLQQAPTMAQAITKMLIHLIKIKAVKASVVNKYLSKD